MEMEDEDQEKPQWLESLGHPRSTKPGAWASCIRIIHPLNGQTYTEIELDQNEAAFSGAICQFQDDDAYYFVLGTAQNVVMTPRSHSAAYLRVYKFNEHGTSLEDVHTTSIEDIPYSMSAFNGRLLVGIGKMLRLYDLGKKKLLRKCESKDFPNFLMDIKTTGYRICVSDIQESIQYAKYDVNDNRLHIFADDPVSRFTSCSVLLDYDTIAGGDKFGNLFVLRLPKDVTDVVDDDPMGNVLLKDRGYLNGAPHRVFLSLPFLI